MDILWHWSAFSTHFGVPLLGTSLNIYYKCVKRLTGTTIVSSFTDGAAWHGKYTDTLLLAEVTVWFSPFQIATVMMRLLDSSDRHANLNGVVVQVVQQVELKLEVVLPDGFVTEAPSGWPTGLTVERSSEL